jgi:hypothetical protein
MNCMKVLFAAILIAAGPAALAQTAINPKGASFPITITQPGSYKLTGNLVVPAGTYGIIVNAPNVTVDLNGYAISGPVTCSASGSCNAASTGSHGVYLIAPNGVLRNGTVTGFAGSGVAVSSGEATIEDLTVSHNTDYGIVGGSSTYPTVVSRVKARLNKLGGFHVSGTTLTGCIAAQNGQHGFYVLASALIDSVSTNNLGTGVLAPAMVGLRGVRAYGNTGGNFSGNYVSAGGNMNEWTLF